MKRIAMVLALLAIGFFPLAASLSRAADTGTHVPHHAEAPPPVDTGNRFCMSGPTMMDGGMMTGMMASGMRHAENANDGPACGMSGADCSSNHSASCGHDMVLERRANECGA